MASEFFRKRIQSFHYAWEGICCLWREEKNTRIHMFFTAAVIVAGILLKVKAMEWCILVLTISAVWFAEAINSALERCVDLVTAEKNPLAKAAKDLAAGAVLILAIGSVVIGLVIFLPKIVNLFVY